MNKFTQKVQEELKYYVYCLVDPENNGIFYIGKGHSNRVFDHIACTISEGNNEESEDQHSLKIDKIKGIQNSGQEVKHYIIRHGLTEEFALEIEATLIDLFQYEDYNLLKSDLTNIQSGHHTFDRGIETVEGLNIKYNCAEIEEDDIQHKLLLISLNKTYNEGEDLYEATRGNWRINKDRAEKIDYIISEYKGISRAIFKADKWEILPDSSSRKRFIGIPVTDENILKLYLNKSFSKLKSKGSQNPIRYFDS